MCKSADLGWERKLLQLPSALAVKPSGGASHVSQSRWNLLHCGMAMERLWMTATADVLALQPRKPANLPGPSASNGRFSTCGRAHRSYEVLF